jgi:hypothetical protein
MKFFSKRNARAKKFSAMKLNFYERFQRRNVCTGAHENLKAREVVLPLAQDNSQYAQPRFVIQCMGILHPKRQWFQIHLSTAVVLVLFAGGVLGANLRPRPSSSYPFG